MKRLLMIINPKAGKMQAAKYLADIVDVFCKGGYETIVATTASFRSKPHTATIKYKP